MMDYREQQRRDELAKRRQEDAAKEDPVFTQCVIAYCNWRRDGGQGGFDLFKRDWYAQRQNNA